MIPLQVLAIDELKIKCPLKWHKAIPDDGIAMGMADIDFKGPDGLLDFLKHNLNDSLSFFYGPFEGLNPAIKAGTTFLQQKKKIAHINPGSIQILPGTMLGIFTVMDWISRKQGEIVMINPIYPPIHTHAIDRGNSINWVNLTDNWRLDTEKLQEQVTTNTKLLVLNNPDNPAGTVFTESELKLIRDLAVDYDFPCFSDELYEPLDFKQQHKSLASLEGMLDRCITLFGYSKANGLAGFRSGFLHIAMPSQELDKIKHIVQQLLVSPSPITSLVMEYALTHPQMEFWKHSFREQMASNTRTAVKRFQEANIDCVEPEGGFFVFPNVGIDDRKFVQFLLQKHGVEVIPGLEFGPAGSGHIRINCATSPERMLQGVDRIIQAIDAFK